MKNHNFFLCNTVKVTFFFFLLVEHLTPMDEQKKNFLIFIHNILPIILHSLNSLNGTGTSRTFKYIETEEL